MPAKFRPSQIVKDRQTGKLKTTHFYLKTTPKEELIEYINGMGKPKIKIKCRNELTRRGVQLVWKTPGTE